MLLKINLNSNVGCTRPNNEDIILLGSELFRNKTHAEDLELNDNVRFAVIVADGMGGYSGGDIASEYAVQFFCDFVQELPAGLGIEELSGELKTWTTKAHQNILKQGIENPEYNSMGTTFVGLLFYEKLVLALNIGDSRVYRYRSEVLKQITKDNSIRELTGDKSLPSNQIYNSLGGGEKVFIDIKDLTGQLHSDDVFMICSDGLSDMVSDDEIEKILSNKASADDLVSAACQAGGKDNVSVVVLSVNSK
jgi:protein phosphatase